MIYDLRFMIAGGGSDRIEDFGQFFGFFAQVGKAFWRKEIRLQRQFDPEICFISLFQRDGNFVDEAGAGLSPQRRL
jgi:hypothetical protein